MSTLAYCLIRGLSQETRKVCSQYVHLMGIQKETAVCEEEDEKDAAAVMSTLAYCLIRGLSQEAIRGVLNMCT